MVPPGGWGPRPHFRPGPIIFRTNTDFRGFEIGQTKDYVKYAWLCQFYFKINHKLDC